MPVSRLFTEVGKDIDRMNESLRQAMIVADQAGIRVSGAGKSMIAAFDAALNPTKALAEQVKLLETVGKSTSDVWQVMGDRMKTAASAAQSNKQAVDPLIQKYLELGKASQQSSFSFESLGKSVQEFAANPMRAAQSGITNLLAEMGPTAIGIGAVTTAIVSAGVAIYEFAANAAKAAESIQNLSYATGLSVEEVQSLQRLGEERGLGDLTSTIEKLNIQLGRPEGGDFTEALLRMGIAIERNKSAIPYLEEMRQHYVQLSEDIGTNAAAQQAAADLGRRLIGSLGPLVLNTEESITKTLREIESSSATRTNSQIDDLTKLNRKIEEHGREWLGLKNTIGNVAGQITLFITEQMEPEFAGMNRSLKELFGWNQPSKIAPKQGVPTAPAGPNIAGDQKNEVPENELTRRAKIIAQADAIAAGTRRELIGLTLKLNELEKQYTDEKQKQKGGFWDDNRIKSLAAQIASTKAVIKDKEDYSSGRKEEVEYDENGDVIAKGMVKREAQLMKRAKLIQAEWDAAMKKLWQPNKQELPEIDMQNFMPKIDDTLPDWIVKLEIDLQNAQHPMDALNEKMANLQIAGASSTDIVKNYADQIIRASQAQTDFGNSLSSTEQAWVHQAMEMQRNNRVKGDAGNLGGGFDDKVSYYKDMLKRLDTLRKIGEIDEKKSTQLKSKYQYEMYSQQLGFASDFFGNLAQLSRSHNRTLAAIGKAAAITQATIDGLMGVMKALGAYAPPYSFIMAAAVGAVAAMNIAKIASTPTGMAKGGLVMGGQREITVNEQGPEFVVNSRATRDFMPMLMAMNSNSISRSAPDFSGLAGAFQRPNMNVTVQNYGTSKDFDVQQIDESTIRVIARDEARSAVNRYGPDVIASDMASPNSRTSKAMSRNTTARRMR